LIRRGAVAALLSLLAAGHAVGAAPPSARLSPALARKIEADVTAALHRFQVPGAVVMVVRNGQVAFVRSFGVRDRARGLPVRDDTLFEIGSLTKQFTAACIVQLAEAGRLQLDRPLVAYLPDAPHAKEVTLRQLLTHTSGLHDYLDSPQALAAQPISYRDLIARITPLPLDFPPGTRWSYSNTNYLLLGQVIEAVSGEAYLDYLRRHILDALHLASAHTTAEEDRLPNMAVGYRHADGRLGLGPHVHPSWAGAAGFLIMTAGDLATWDAALAGGAVVSPAGYRAMAASAMTTQNGSANYGFGFFVDSAYGQPRIGHTGGSLAFTTADEYFPKQDSRIIAFTNLGDDAPEAGEMLTNVVFADLFPALAAKAMTPAPGENPAVAKTVREAFRELQSGSGYDRFSAHLKGKLAGGAGARFVAALAPYGAATAATFKGARRDAKGAWYDYVLQFAPGVSLPFSVRLEPNGAVGGFSLG
jgi:CubicO group peptidase (beta-lactamase class C family)